MLTMLLLSLCCVTEPLHSEEWLRKQVSYLSDCQRHRSGLMEFVQQQNPQYEGVTSPCISRSAVFLGVLCMGCVSKSPYTSHGACGLWQLCLHKLGPCGFSAFFYVTLVMHVTPRDVRMPGLPQLIMSRHRLEMSHLVQDIEANRQVRYRSR